jgi:hypothetical protein
VWLAFLTEHGVTDTYNNCERGIHKCVTNITDTRIKNVFHSEKIARSSACVKASRLALYSPTLRYVTTNSTADNVGFNKHRFASQRLVRVEVR